MSQQERAVITPQVIQGFNGKNFKMSCLIATVKVYYWIDLCKEAGSSVNGGQSVLNPWFIIGGVASAVCKKDEFIMSVIIVTLSLMITSLGLIKL